MMALSKIGRPGLLQFTFLSSDIGNRLSTSHGQNPGHRNKAHRISELPNAHPTHPLRVLHTVLVPGSFSSASGHSKFHHPGCRSSAPLSHSYPVFMILTTDRNHTHSSGRNSLLHPALTLCSIPLRLCTPEARTFLMALSSSCSGSSTELGPGCSVS
ncbi:hypothetical protein BCR34DRAFT_89281 [Clohesyomyces aquaticus]|uniref:Uncharacterized protein n=1 Tax=Clohesyomyces aquaticus TaxID=1231657 RepID=A0A1Y1YVU2_9PLEO|nr:hypothetical protein BCR34DRAFT_89281 [Clohesyomyces aquaticus]